jgi:hypothetical protein
LQNRRSLAIEINRRALLRVVRWMAGMLPEGGLTRGVWLAVLVILRPAESAARRLVALMALDMVVVPPVRRENGPSQREKARKGMARGMALALCDRRTRPDASSRRGPKARPQIRDLLLDGPTGNGPARAPLPDDPVDGVRLTNRIEALRAALEDLPKPARRLARMRAAGRMKWPYAMRPGRPPGYRQRWRHPVDETLADCNGLFWMAVREMEREIVPP